MKRTKFNSKHNWNKISWNPDKEGYYLYQCAICRTTGKRHESSSSVIADHKFNCK